eukprot:SAG11_NODE_2958_length_2809_cov_4.732841_1_plen_158_part_00
MICLTKSTRTMCRCDARAFSWHAMAYCAILDQHVGRSRGIVGRSHHVRLPHAAPPYHVRSICCVTPPSLEHLLIARAAIFVRVWCSAMPIIGTLLQCWLDDLSRGRCATVVRAPPPTPRLTPGRRRRPIRPDDPEYAKYFTVPAGGAANKTGSKKSR